MNAKIALAKKSTHLNQDFQIYNMERAVEQRQGENICYYYSDAYKLKINSNDKGKAKGVVLLTTGLGCGILEIM